MGGCTFVNSLLQKRHNHGESSITVKMSLKTQQILIYHTNERSGLAFLSTDLGNVFGSIVVNEFGVMMRKKRLHKPKFADNLVPTHS